MYRRGSNDSKWYVFEPFSLPLLFQLLFSLSRRFPGAGTNHSQARLTRRQELLKSSMTSQRMYIW